MASTDCSLEKKQQDLLAAQDDLLMCKLRCAKLLLQRDKTRDEREKLAERERELETELAQETARRKDFANLVRSLEEDIASYTQLTSQIDKMNARIGELETSASALKAEVRELEKVRETKQVMCRKIADNAQANTANMPDGKLMGPAQLVKVESTNAQLIQNVPALARQAILFIQKRQSALFQAENRKIITAKEFQAIMQGPRELPKRMPQSITPRKSSLNVRPRFKLDLKTKNTNG